MTRAILGLIAVISVSLPYTGLSYGKEVKKGKGAEGWGYFMAGTNLIDIGALNSELEKKGYPKLSESFFSSGGGGCGRIGRVIIGGEGYGLIGEKTTSESYEISIGAGCGFFDIGFIAISYGDLMVYPIFGLGGGGLSLTIKERGTPSFDEILESPKRGVEISTGGLLFNLALGMHYLIKLGGERNGGGILVGICLGYTFAPMRGSWSMDGVEISGGPKVGITGPYVRFMIGGGGKGEAK